MRTSGGTFGFVASSSNGSPGASARMVKSTRLMPSRAGMRIRIRRKRYLDIDAARAGDRARGPGLPVLLALAVPVLEVPEVRVPPALLHAHRVRDGGHARAEHHGNDHDVLDHQFVHLDEERRLLDHLLVLLAQGVDGRRVDHLQLLAVLGPDPVGALLPARCLEDLVRLVDVELPLGALGGEARRLVEEVRGGDAGAAVNLFLDGPAVDEEIQRLAHGRVGQERMLGLDAGALAVDLRPGIRVVELDVLDVAAGHDVGLALAALLQALENLVLDLEVPRVVELARLDDGTRGRDRVAAALHLDGVEEGTVRQVIGRVSSPLTMSP